MEINIKKSSDEISKLKKELNLKEKKIQTLMNELSVCKESKIKYIEKNDNDYQIIDDGHPAAAAVEIHRRVSLQGIASLRPPEDITGKCKKSDIRRVFHNLKPYFIKCFENNGVKKGFISFSWIINEDGDVVKVNLIKNNIYNKNLSDCLKIIIKKGRYNSPESGVCSVAYTFKL